MDFFGFILSTQDLWLLRICGTLVMAWIVYRLTLGLKNRSSFNQAADSFAKVLGTIKATIQVNPDLTSSQIADQILKASYPDQKTVMENLHKRLGLIRKCTFRKAWQKYVDPEECDDEPFLGYCGLPYEEGKSFDRQYILKAIKHLISFANR